MSRPRLPSFVSHPRHPLTGKQLTIRGSNERELAAKLHRIQSLREELNLDMVTRQDVDKKIRRLLGRVVTLERATNAYTERCDLSPDTRTRAQSVLRSSAAQLAQLELDALDAPTLAKWIESLHRKGLAASSISATWRMLRAIIRYACERGWIGQPPWGAWRPTIRSTKTPRARREALRDVAELAALLEAAREDDLRTGRALFAVILVTAMLGIRQGEIAGLAWLDVDEEHGTITIARQWDGRPPKGKKARTLRTTPALFEALREHKARLEARELYAPNGPIFPDPRTSKRGAPLHRASGESLTSSSLRRVVSLARLPDPERWSAHSLRDSFATLEAAHHGSDLNAVAARTGHASLTSLLRYLRSLSRALPEPGFDPSSQPRALPPSQRPRSEQVSGRPELQK